MAWRLRTASYLVSNRLFHSEKQQIGLLSARMQQSVSLVDWRVHMGRSFLEWVPGCVAFGHHFGSLRFVDHKKEGIPYTIEQPLTVRISIQ